MCRNVLSACFRSVISIEVVRTPVTPPVSSRIDVLVVKNARSEPELSMMLLLEAGRRSLFPQNGSMNLLAEFDLVATKDGIAK